MRRRLPCLVLLGVFVVCALVWKNNKPAEQPIADLDAPVRRLETTTNETFAAIAPPRLGMTGLDLEKCPPKVRVLLDLQRSALERQSSIRTLGTGLTEEELEPLYAFLLAKQAEDTNQIGHVIKSDLMDLLCRQETVSSNLLAVLAEIYNDSAQNIVVRDYAVQHLAWLYERLHTRTPWPIELAEAQQEKTLQLLWEATSEDDNSIAGTALLALDRLTTQYGLSKTQLLPLALELADNSSVSLLVRISAIEVCTAEQPAVLLPILRRIAERETDTTLRIVAIGCLGSAGGQAELNFLRRIEAQNTPRLTPAIKFAMHQIEERL